MELNEFDFDWKSLLIKKYRNYDLDEEDCMVIFVADAVLHIQPKILITKEVLSPYMKNTDLIDASLSRLISKKIFNIHNEDAVFFTSLDDFKKKLYDDMIKDFVLKTQNASYASAKSDSLYQDIEEIANRSLSPIERDQITSWLKSGADEGMIREACQKTLTKSGNINFKGADKLILEMERSQSRSSVGASTVNENEKRREELKELFDNTDWTYHGDK